MPHLLQSIARNPSHLRDPLLSDSPRLRRIGRSGARLGRGAHGDAVLRLQEALARLGHPTPPTLGKFDHPLADALREFQRRHRMAPTGVLCATTLFELDASLQGHATPQPALDLLQGAEPTLPEYATAIATWPDDRPIWPLLRDGAAKLQFARYCLTLARAGSLAIRDTAHRDELAAAAVVYARSSSRARLGDGARARLQARDPVAPCPMPPKLCLPLLLATGSDHAFNAVYLGGHTRAITSYLFITPLDDELIVPRSDLWYDLVARDWILLSDLVDVAADGRLSTRTVGGFVAVEDGTMRALSHDHAASFAAMKTAVDALA